MKKNIIYIIIALLVGLLIGFLIFNNQSTSAEENKTEDHNHSTEEVQMWTCSMHPQIMQPEPGNCPICGMELIPAEHGADNMSANAIKMTPNAMALANIQTMLISDPTEENEEHSLSLSGKIVANEEANAVQASYFEGRIEKLYVNFTGDQVKKGQLLASIYAPSLVNAQQELLTTASMKASQPELYKAVRNKLKLWKLTDSQINQIEASGKPKEVFPVYATVSGTVSEKLAQEGDYVSQGQALLKVSNLNSVWAIFDAYENEISNLKVGDPITVISNAYPDKTYNAKISFIDPVLNVSSRTVAVRATLNNSNGLLKPGMFVTGTVQKKNSKPGSSALQVPASAVMWTGKRSLVYVKTNPNEPIFEMREVKLGQRSGDLYTITDGLSKGEEIVVNGTFTVDAAAQLQGKKSMMTQVEPNQHQNENNDENVESQSIKVSSKFKKQFNNLLDAYISLKNALVNDDAAKTQKLANRLEKNLNAIQAELLKDEKAKEVWHKINEELSTSIAKIKSTGEISQQRSHFIQLSKTMLNSVHTFGVNQKVYSMFCPMANNNKGAYWLSLEKEVMNPFFGQAMSNCGEVREIIQ